MIETEDHTIHDWLCGEDCICQELWITPKTSTLTPSSIHSEREDLIKVIRGQRELAELPASCWFDIFCIDCEKSEVSTGRETIGQFADRVRDLGWAVDSVERSTAICSACANKEDEAHYASQYEDERGLLG